VLIGLRQAGVRIASVSVTKPTLDEVFLALTGHDTNRPEQSEVPDEVVHDETILEVA